MTTIQKPVAVVMPRSLEPHQAGSIAAFLSTMPTAPWTLASRHYSKVRSGMAYTNNLTIRYEHEQPVLKTNGWLTFLNLTLHHRHDALLCQLIADMADQPDLRAYVVFQEAEDAALWVKAFGGRISTDPMFAKHFV